MCATIALVGQLVFTVPRRGNGEILSADRIVTLTSA
jgi:hypothetical protein